MSSKQKTVIRLGVPNDKNRSKAMQLASQSVGVNSVAITGGDAKDRLEVVGESIDIPCLINRLRKKVCRADIVVVEEVKDKKLKEDEEEKKKKKEEEEAKKKKKAEEDKKQAEEEKRRKKEEEELKKPWPAQPCYPGPPPTFLCEEQQPQGCYIM